MAQKCDFIPSSGGILGRGFDHFERNVDLFTVGPSGEEAERGDDKGVIPLVLDQPDGTKMTPTELANDYVTIV